MTGPADHDDPDGITDLLAASSLGRPEVVARTAAVPPADVADVLDRLDRLDDRVAEGRHTAAEQVDEAGLQWAGATHGPLVEWRRELDLLLRRGAPAATGERLRPLLTGELSRAEIDRRLLGDVELARDLVDALGGDWAAGHHRRLLRAARVQAGLERPRAMARRLSSGFASAVHQGLPARSLVAPVETLPVVHGRDALIADVLAALGPGAPTTVLVGDAGYGKTTAALAVARDARDVLTLWIVAHDAASLVDGLEQVAVRLEVTTRALEIARHHDPELHARRLWSLLDRRPQRWLLVIDDVGPDAVGRAAWLHRPRRGAVLITTRYGDEDAWGPDAAVVPMHRLEPEHGGRLLLDVITPRRLSTTVRAQARHASELLSGMPLALISVGTLLRSRGGGALEELVASLGRRAPAGALETAYEMCLGAVDGGGSVAARRLLRLLSCFAADTPLPRRVVAGAPETGWPGGHGVAVDGLASLVRVGLVEERVVDGDAAPALLVQTAVAEHARRDPAFTVDDVAALDQRAVGLLATEVERIDPGAPPDWPAVSALEPHVAEVLESPALVDPAAAERALALADRAAEGLMRVGDHTTATTLLDRALARLGWLAADRPAVLAARRTRAWMVALEGGGDLRRAGQLLVGLLAETREVLGADHLTTLAVQDCLGWVRAEQGDLAQGGALLEEVLAARRRLVGDAHPDALATRHRLGWIAAVRGQHRAALVILADVLDARERLLGSEHLDVFSTRYRLAWTLNELGRHAESERSYRELIADTEAALGERHPLTLMVRGRLAWSLAWLNRFADAERVYEQLRVDQEKVLGVDHPRVFTTGHFLAMLWLAQGRVADAEQRLAEVVARRSEVLGAEHPLTLESRSYHAWTLFGLGSVAVAEAGLQAVFADRVGVLGERHPETLTTRYLLARVLMHRGRPAEAERRLRGLLADMAGVFTPDHRTVLRTQVALAGAVGLQDDVGEAERLLRDVIAERTRTLGPDHRETLAAGDQMCWVLGRGGRLAEAEAMCAEIATTRRRILGPDHPHTLTSRYRQAWIVLRQGRHRAARRRFARLLADLRRTVGDRHPDTLRCRTRYVETLRLDTGPAAASTAVATTAARDLVRDLVEALGEDAVETMRGREELGRLALARGDTAEARRILREVLERRRRVLGDDHSDTLRSVEDVDGLR